jgi:hypothetical protein
MGAGGDPDLWPDFIFRAHRYAGPDFVAHPAAPLWPLGARHQPSDRGTCGARRGRHPVCDRRFADCGHPRRRLPEALFRRSIDRCGALLGNSRRSPISPRDRGAPPNPHETGPAHPSRRPGEPSATVGRREPATSHFSAPSRPSTRRNISCTASTPDIILPISSGGIAVIILALSLRPPRCTTTRPHRRDLHLYAGARQTRSDRAAQNTSDHVHVLLVR